MTDNSQQALARALYKLLRPMARLLLRHGVSYRLFSEIARRAFVDVAMEDFTLPGRKPTLARAAVLTGINRKDIAKLQERPHPLASEAPSRPGPAVRVIDAWLNDERFVDAEGQPLTLPIDSEGTSFSQLVKDYSSDVPVRALLDELVRIGAAERRDEGIQLTHKGYIPFADNHEKMRIMGTAASDLLSTLDHNLDDTCNHPHIQRTVSYDNIPLELLEQIRARSRAEGEAFILQINKWLAQQDRGVNPQVNGSGRARAGIGIYYFEHPEPLAGEESKP